MAPLARWITVAALLSAASGASAGTTRVELRGFQRFVSPPVSDADESRLVRASQGRAPFSTEATPPLHTALFPTYVWPLERGVGDGFVLVNYIDHDPAVDAVRDYQNGIRTYDGHNGTDITLYNFRLMDRGVRIVAGAPGTVFYTTWDKYDRNYGTEEMVDTENNVLVDNGDGTTTWYLHLRRNSVTVQPGDVVQRGTPLGLVGSSGYSTDPHLHFEVGQYTPGWVPRDPWNGPANPVPSLWNPQQFYTGTQPLWIADMGVTTAAAAGGNLDDVPIELFKERLTQPAVLGANETLLPIWMLLQGRAGDAYRIEIQRPDNSIYSAADYTLPDDFSYGWHFWYWSWNGFVPPSTYGTWTARVLLNSVERKRVAFQVGAASVYGPRFWPIAGRSYRINGSVQKDTVRVSPLGGPVTYTLVSPPAGVTLADTILTIPATTSLTRRSAYFQVIAADGAARRDTAWYQVVDLSKPLDQPLAVDGTSDAARVWVALLAPARPNPFASTARIDYTVPRDERVVLAVFDVAGRRVRTLADGVMSAGAHAAVWDGTDDRGRRLANGVFLCRLEAGEERRQQTLLLLH